MSLEDQLAKWAKSSAGKAKIKEVQKQILKNGGRGRGCAQTPAFCAEEFINILRQEIALAGFEYGEYLYWTDIGYNNASDCYEIHVNFKDYAVERPSLYPKKYPDGVDNIAALMNAGYHAKDYVYGTMADGRRGRSLKDRRGEFFMQSAVERFNALYGLNAIAEYGDQYAGGINLSWD